MGVFLSMTYKIPKGYEKAENQEFESPEEASRFIRKYCNKCLEMKSKEKCPISKELREKLVDGFDYWADAFIALNSVEYIERRVECSSFVKGKK
jgi:hypothetical protein